MPDSASNPFSKRGNDARICMWRLKHMQNIFLSKHKPEDYVEKDGVGEYPAAPKKCPFGDCGVELVMKKNGFYLRMLITIALTYLIRVRRYKCPKCGKTLSMLPSFCLSGISYSADYVVALLQYAINKGSIRKTVREWLSIGANISRRLVNKYMTRLRNNRWLIQYGLNQLPPDNIGLGRSSGGTEWTKAFLSGMRPSLCPEFNANFHKTTGKSFMSTATSVTVHKMISQPDK
jgi:transposase-like protein